MIGEFHILALALCLLTVFKQCSVAVCSTAAADADEVLSLPGLSLNISFKHYSGFLQVRGDIHLHYWFIESERDPNNDPLLLWMNGGPGCSSVDGLLTEHGPFILDNDMNITLRDTSWNKLANIIYLEAPVGVGFSYGNLKNISDTSTADNNYLALKQFFIRFPEFANHDFYISGESYAGIYVPTLAARVIKDPSIRLKGIAIGNGLLNQDNNINSLMYFSYYHGILGKELWVGLQSACCLGSDDRCKSFFNNNYFMCSHRFSLVTDRIFKGDLNIYGIYADCRHHRKLFSMMNNKQYIGDKISDITYTAPPCFTEDVLTGYLNNDNVKEALHIPDRAETYWTICNLTVYHTYHQNYRGDVIEILKQLAQKLPILLYFGDADAACNFIGGLWNAEALNLKQTGEYRSWHIDTEIGRSLAGYKQQFGKVDYVTIRGAGHMVPSDRPQAAFKLIRTFLSGGNLD